MGVVGVVPVQGVPDHDQGLDQLNPNGTVRSTAFGTRLRACPTPGLLLADGVGRLDRPFAPRTVR
jgi:hypothetical protein